MRVILFILYPLIGFFSSLKDLKAPFAAIVFVAFYALFGYCQDFLLQTADIYRIGLWFQYLEASDIIAKYQQGDITDIYLFIVMSVVKLFSNNPKTCIAVFGVIYGYFSYLCVKPVYEFWSGKKNMPFYLCVLLALSNISLIHMTGIRFFTAAAVFTAIMIQVLLKRRRYMIFTTLLTPFIHFGFIPIVIMVFVYYFVLRRFFTARIRLLKVVIVISFVISFIPLRSISGSFLSQHQLTENSAINVKFASYSSTDITSEEPADADTAYRKANNIFTFTFNCLRNIGLMYFILAIFKRQEFNKRNMVEQSMLMYIAIFSIFSFLSNSLISSGGRLFALPLAFVYIYYAKVFCENKEYFGGMIKKLVFYNFYNIAFLLFNAPRLVTFYLWIAPLPAIIIDGWGYKIA